MPEAEEIFDLLFYRPLAFLFVKSIEKTPLSPNHVTLLSGAAGVIAAWQFSIGTTNAMAWGAVWYAVANILDCADGQLARLQGSGTLLGRIVDGATDYVSTVAIFIGIGLSLPDGSGWWLVVAAGVSSAVHALLFDHYQSEFISIVRAERNFLEREIEQFSQEVERLRIEGGRRFRSAILALYVRYLQLQKSSSTKKGNAGFDPATYRSGNAMMIRLWSFLGPTTNRTMLIVCALFGTIPIYLWGIVTIGNMWFVVSYLLQRRIHHRLSLMTASETPGQK